MDILTADIMLKRFERARSRRGQWESLWQDCYEYALPRRDGSLTKQTAGETKRQNLFDGTAPDAVEQLASSLMAELTPAWSSWFQLTTGIEVQDTDRTAMEKKLTQLSQAIQGHFDRSNFIVELHQCYLDLVTVGTACLMFEETKFGEASAFKFTAVPLGEVVMEEGPKGRLDTIYRKSEVTETILRARFPKADIPESMKIDQDMEEEARYHILEAVLPNKSGRYDYLAVLVGEEGSDGQPLILSKGQYESTPFIVFRWIKAPGEIYGRSPVMKALPDIKTANKIVELMLKNASIAVTGIWQADDDGVLNPATIKLTPGTVIPKAVGSKGLQPLIPAGDIGLSEQLLEKIRGQISIALYRDQLGQPMAQGMSATEFVERTEAATRNLSAIFGRLHGEMILPIAERALAILRRRGDIDDIQIDGREVNLQINAPLAIRQRMQKAKPIIRWLDMVKQASPEASGLLKNDAVGRYLAEILGLPEEFLHSAEETEANATTAAQQGQTEIDPAQMGAAQAGMAGMSGMAGNLPDLSGLDMSNLPAEMQHADVNRLRESLPPEVMQMAEDMANRMSGANPHDLAGS